MKFYIKDNLAYINQAVIPVFNADLRITELTDIRIKISSLSGAFLDITSNITTLKKENGTTYADIDELKEVLPSFFFIDSALNPNFSIFLSTNGDGTGVVNGANDYRGEPVEFYYERPLSAKLLKILSFIILIGENSNFEWDEYGDLNPLTNGVLITVNNIDLLGGNPIKRNIDLKMSGFEAEYLKIGNATRYIHAKLNLTGFELKPGEQFTVTLNDRFNQLDEHYFKIIGHE